MSPAARIIVDVVKEVDALGLTGYFTEIAGTPEGKVGLF